MPSKLEASSVPGMATKRCPTPCGANSRTKAVCPRCNSARCDSVRCDFGNASSVCRRCCCGCFFCRTGWGSGTLSMALFRAAIASLRASRRKLTNRKMIRSRKITAPINSAAPWPCPCEKSGKTMSLNMGMSDTSVLPKLYFEIRTSLVRRREGQTIDLFRNRKLSRIRHSPLRESDGLPVNSMHMIAVLDTAAASIFLVCGFQGGQNEARTLRGHLCAR